MSYIKICRNIGAHYYVMNTGNLLPKTIQQNKEKKNKFFFTKKKNKTSYTLEKIYINEKKKTYS